MKTLLVTVALAMLAPLTAANPVDDAQEALEPVQECVFNSQCPSPQQVQDAAEEVVEEYCPDNLSCLDPVREPVNEAKDEAQDQADAAVAIAMGLANDALGLVGDTVEPYHDMVDDDRDNMPDALEPTICYVENQNSNSDGYCIGNDWHR